MLASVATFNELHERVEPMDALVVVDNEIHEMKPSAVNELTIKSSNVL